MAEWADDGRWKGCNLMIDGDSVLMEKSIYLKVIPHLDQIMIL